MDPYPFVRIVISNLSLKLPSKNDSSSSSSSSSSLYYYCKMKLKGLPTQVCSIPLTHQQHDESKIHGCFTFTKLEFDKFLERFNNSCVVLAVEIYARPGRKLGCGSFKGGKLLGRSVVSVGLDYLKGYVEGSCRSFSVHNGWIFLGKNKNNDDDDGVKLHLNVRAESDPRFVFEFDGEPECSPQVFQVNGNVKQPVFTCKFSFRNNYGESRSTISERSTSTSCFGSFNNGDGDGDGRKKKKKKPLKERKGWSVTIHDLCGSPVAAASMVTPFVPSRGTDRVSRSNPGAWLILRPGQGTWKPWGRLEAWREGNSGDRVGYRFELMPDGSIDAVTLANSAISTKNGGKFSIDITNGTTPVTSPGSSFDLSSGSGSGSDLGSSSGSGSWAQLLYRGFVMSSTVEGGGKCSKPEVEVGVHHVTCTEDAAAFVALAAAMDLSMDACRSFSHKLRKELSQPQDDWSGRVGSGHVTRLTVLF